MPTPDISSVHKSAALTNIAIDWRNAEYVLTGAFPEVPVRYEKDDIHKWTKGDFFRDEAVVIAPDDEIPLGGFNLDADDSYALSEYAYGWAIPDRIRENMDPSIAADVAATRKVADKILLAQERQIAAAITGASWTPTGVTIGGGDEWDDATPGSPYDDIETVRKNVRTSIGIEPNTMIWPWETELAVLKHSDILNRIQYVGSRPAMATKEMLQAIFGIPRILTVKAVYNSGGEGETVTMAPVLTDTVWIGYVAPAPSIIEPSAGYLFTKRGSMVVETFREPKRRRDVVTARKMFQPKILSLDSGALITNTLV